MAFKRSVPERLSIFWRYLYAEKGLSIKEIIRRYPEYSTATIYRHCKKEVWGVAKSAPMLVTLPRTQGKKSRRQQEPRVVYFGRDNKIMLWRLVNVCVSQVIV